MKTKKSIFRLALLNIFVVAVAVCVLCSPRIGLADEFMMITVGNSTFSEDDSRSGSGWSYDGNEKILYLNGYNGDQICTSGDLTVYSKGKVRINASSNIEAGLHAKGDLNVVVESGTLTVNGKASTSNENWGRPDGNKYKDGGHAIWSGSKVYVLLVDGSLSATGGSSSYGVGGDAISSRELAILRTAELSDGESDTYYGRYNDNVKITATGGRGSLLGGDALSAHTAILDSNGVFTGGSCSSAQNAGYAAFCASALYIGWDESVITATLKGGSNYVQPIYSTATQLTEHQNSRAAALSCIEYSPKVYTVNFDSNGGIAAPGNNPETITHEYPFVIDCSKRVYTKEDYYMNGFVNSAGTAVAGDADYVVTGNTTLTAQWQPMVKYNITFDANGGNLEATTLQTSGNGKLSSLPTPTKDDYQFAGWYTAAENGNKVDLSTSYTEDTTLYAHWVKEHTVTFDANGGVITNSTGKTNGESKLTDMPTPIKDGYLFIGWYTTAEDGDKVDLNKVYTEDTTLYAHWKLPYTITFDANEGNVTTESATTNINDKLDKLPTATKSGYSFSGWYTDVEGGDKINADTIFTQDTTVYAHYKQRTSGGGSATVTAGKPSITGNGDGGKVVADDKGNVTITPDKGYKVKDVTVNGKSVGAQTSLSGMTTKDKVVVTFEKDTAVTPGGNFADVPVGHWAEKAVAYVYENGLFQGTSATSFEPNTAMNRGMLVTVLWRLDGKPAANAQAAFADVKSGDYYSEAVAWANANGIVKGYTANQFAPNDKVTREQMAAILVRYAEHKGYATTANADLSAFTDGSKVSAYALDGVKWANSVGLMTGCTDTTLAPQGDSTRAEVASMIQRFAQNVVK